MFWHFLVIFGFTGGDWVTGDWDCVAAVERLPALHYTLKDFKNAKNENYYFLNPEHF